MNNNKFVSQAGEMQVVRNENLMCANCKFAYTDAVSTCVRYLVYKPLKVLQGGWCEKYEKE